MRQILPYSFESAQVQWSKVPVDNVGYISVSNMLVLHDKELRRIVETFRSSELYGQSLIGRKVLRGTINPPFQSILIRWMFLIIRRRII